MDARVRRLLALGLAFGLPFGGLGAQTIELDLEPGFESEAENERVAQADGAVLRGLDKMTGSVTNLSIAQGETLALGKLEITLGECRYPANNPAGNAFAYLVIREANDDAPDFAGWMIAAAPALNALEHPRYDIWVMRCSI